MKNWQGFCSQIKPGKMDIAELKEMARANEVIYGVYPDSIHLAGGCLLFMAHDEQDKKLIVQKIEGDVYQNFSGEATAINGVTTKICDLSNENCRMIRKMFPFTNPVSHQGRKITLGLGDRLGLASAGHIRLLKNYDVFPVLAQQSIRELTLTNRTYDDVLSAAAWAVFQEDYHSGYGADGDHLKTADEVRMALNFGFTMITLDCSEHIFNGAADLPAAEIDKLYSQLPEAERNRLEAKYAGKNFPLSEGYAVKFSLEDLKRTVLVYYKAIQYTISIYQDVIAQQGGKIDFEMSIDETLTSTTPEAHFFTASELIDGGVKVTSLAPRFYGEFQKGIDYRGEIGRFTQEFVIHCQIAQFFGYKISVHSGSDKFTVFPIVGEKTGGKYHLKTAGTNWLEAVRIIAAHCPDLYRRMHQFALENLDAAKKYYHISAKPENIAPLTSLNDRDLPGLMNQDDARQVLHITYGLILQAKKPDGSALFRDEFYTALNQYEPEYSEALQKHIGRHLTALGLEPHSN